MANSAQRRFVELSVGEVSLVDSPANEEEFAVIKSLNAMEETMSDEKNTEAEVNTDEAEDTTEEQVEKVELEVPASEDDAVKKAMEKVTETVEAIAQKAGITVEAEADTEDEGEETEKAKPSPFQGSGIKELFIAKLKKAGMKGDELKEAIADFDKAAAKAAPPWLKPKGKGKAKAEGEEEDMKTKKAADAEPGTLLEQLTAEIEKAKRFTPKRADALKGAIEALAKLQSELEDSEPAKAQLPGNTQFGASGIKEITKSIGELAESFKESLTEVVETQKKLDGRLEAVEKERQPSTSVDEEGGTDKEKTVEKGLWSGVI